MSEERQCADEGTKIDVSSRIQEIVDALSRIISGDLTLRLESSPRMDEIDYIAVGITVLTEELREAFRALGEADKRYRRMVDTDIKGILMIDEEGKTSYANHKMARMLGYTVKEMLGRPLTDFVNEEDVPTAEEKIDRSRRGIKEQYDFRFQRRDGTVLWAIVSATPHFNGDGSYAGGVSMLTDITERKHVEEALRESEQRFKDVAFSSADLVWEVDREGRFTYCSDSVRDVLGYTLEEIEGQRLFEFMTPDECERLKKIYAWVARNRLPIKDLENNYIKKDGKVVVMLTNGVPIVDGRGKLLGYRGVLKDITEHKQIDEERTRINEELESRVEERTAQLEDANKELESFSYSVSHDLRTPLRAIASFSRIIIEENSADLDVEARHRLDLVVQNAVRMEELIKGILEFSRTGWQEMRMSRIDMEELTDDVFIELTTGATGRFVDFKLDRLPAARGDRLLIHQVLTNLISNAIKFTGKEEKPRIEIGGKAEAEENVYWVKDNGVGFDTRYADKLFKVFSRLHSSDDFEGTGIGLANVQRILRRHGGRSWAESELGQGATFYFTLPSAGL